MKKVGTTFRCIPRLGLPHTQVRLIEVDLDADADADEAALFAMLQRQFAQWGLPDAVYAVEYDDDGPLAVINDEAYLADWGETLL